VSVGLSLLAVGVATSLPLTPVSVSGREVPRISLWCGPDSEAGSIFLVELGHSPVESIFRVSAIEKATGKSTEVISSTVGAEGNNFADGNGDAAIQSASGNELVSLSIKSGRIVSSKFEFKDGRSVSSCLQVPNMNSGPNK